MTFTTFSNVLEGRGTVSFDISDDESEDHGQSCTSLRTLLVIRQPIKPTDDNGDVVMQDSLRRIAGTRRVSNYRQKKGLAPTTTAAAAVSNGQMLQSITAIPALAALSFEEIRLECYNQSVIATGKPPHAVNAVLNPSAVIPPIFIPVHDNNAEEPNSVAMANVWCV